MTQKEAVTRYASQLIKTCAKDEKHFSVDSYIYIKSLCEKILDELEQTEHDYSGFELIHEILEGK